MVNTRVLRKHDCFFQDQINSLCFSGVILVDEIKLTEGNTFLKETLSVGFVNLKDEGDSADDPGPDDNTLGDHALAVSF